MSARVLRSGAIRPNGAALASASQDNDERANDDAARQQSAMSVYRGWKPRLVFEPDSHPEAVTERASGPARPDLRKAQPLETLLPRTKAWITALPEDAQPHNLVKRYARIANAFASTWDDPDGCRKYFDDLLMGKRGGRKGFPPEVLDDLLRLRRLYSELHPTTDSAWQVSTR